MSGGDGSDVFYAGRGNDVLNGDAGDDVFVHVEAKVTIGSTADWGQTSLRSNCSHLI